MIDAHIHLEQYEGNTIFEDLKKWQEAGITGVIAVSNDLSSSYRTLELTYQFPEFVHAALGFHPEQPLPSELDYLEWEQLVHKERGNIVAIGEIGLPHYNLANLPFSLKLYNDFLDRCLGVAAQNHLPVALHAVHDKAQMVLDLVEKNQITHAHFHWLKAPTDVIQKIVQAGYFISVTPEVCYRSRDHALVKQVPLSQLLIETDGPWPYKGDFTALPTTPLFLQDILTQLALLYRMEEKELRNLLLANTQRCYRIRK
ncbi:TatD family hydrolase [Ferdinandcohnia sp. Marseille-Q9671]